MTTLALILVFLPCIALPLWMIVSRNRMNRNEHE